MSNLVEWFGNLIRPSQKILNSQQTQTNKREFRYIESNQSSYQEDSLHHKRPKYTSFHYEPIKQDESLQISPLPSELICKILSHLGDMNSLLHASQVCKLWNAISNLEEVWRSNLETTHPDSIPCIKSAIEQYHENKCRSSSSIWKYYYGLLTIRNFGLLPLSLVRHPIFHMSIFASSEDVYKWKLISTKVMNFSRADDDLSRIDKIIIPNGIKIDANVLSQISIKLNVMGDNINSTTLLRLTLNLEDLFHSARKLYLHNTRGTAVNSVTPVKSVSVKLHPNCKCECYRKIKVTAKINIGVSSIGVVDEAEITEIEVDLQDSWCESNIEMVPPKGWNVPTILCNKDL